MKVNLLLDNPGDIRSGYRNIDPFANDIDIRVSGTLDNLSDHVEANEAEEIVANDILDTFPLSDADRVLDNWLSRLAHGGKLTISVVDLRSVSREVLANSISIQDANELLYGRQNAPHFQKKSVFTLQQLATTLEGKGYKLLRRQVENNRVVVTVERP
jgi:hypothetical protein